MLGAQQQESVPLLEKRHWGVPAQAHGCLPVVAGMARHATTPRTNELSTSNQQAATVFTDKSKAAMLAKPAVVEQFQTGPLGHWAAVCNTVGCAVLNTEKSTLSGSKNAPEESLQR